MAVSASEYPWSRILESSRARILESAPKLSKILVVKKYYKHFLREVRTLKIYQ